MKVTTPVGPWAGARYALTWRAEDERLPHDGRGGALVTAPTLVLSGVNVGETGADDEPA